MSYLVSYGVGFLVSCWRFTVPSACFDGVRFPRGTHLRLTLVDLFFIFTLFRLHTFTQLQFYPLLR